MENGMMERIWIWLAWHLPRPLVYWAAIRLATWNWKLGPDDRSVSEALRSWERE
jgi:hypothetical protein